MFIAGLEWKYVIGVGAVGGGAMLTLALLGDNLGMEHWSKRLTSFMDPFADAQGDGYQVVQSLLALGSGGLFGLGLGKSIQKNLYLPEPQNDVILAIIGEELGLIGLLASDGFVRGSDLEMFSCVHQCAGSFRYASDRGALPL